MARTHRTTAVSVVAVLFSCLAVGAWPVTGSAAAPQVRVLHGNQPQINAVFPNDRFTVKDTHEVTGQRVDMPPPPLCTSANSSICASTRLINTLDGFDIQPRVYVPFSGAIDVKTVTPQTIYVKGPDGRAGIYEIVLDPKSHILEGTVDRQLAEDSHYTLFVTCGVHDTHGRPIASAVRVPFTTMTATWQLDRIRRSLDNGRAYTQARIGAGQRGLSFRQGKLTTVFAGDTVVKFGMTRNDQVFADPKKPLSSSAVPDLVDAGTVGWYAFGSYLSPQFVTRQAVIPPVPTKQTPSARRAARLGFAMLVPSGTPPAGGWPVAVYGPGFTRSYFDLYVTADHNAAMGIATVSIDPLGHGFGPKSTITINNTTFRSYGRGHDLDAPAAPADHGRCGHAGLCPVPHRQGRSGPRRSGSPGFDGGCE